MKTWSTCHVSLYDIGGALASKNTLECVINYHVLVASYVVQHFASVTFFFFFFLQILTLDNWYLISTLFKQMSQISY